jgi:hypothetical protein
MKKEFIPYEQALALKELGFNEPCIMTYLNGELDKELFLFNHSIRSHSTQEFISAPLYQQAFRWFREKYTTKGWVTPIVNVDGFSDTHEARIHQEESSVLVLGNYDSYEEAELACLEKLIEIVESKLE